MQKDTSTDTTSTLVTGATLAEAATGHGRTMVEAATGHGRAMAETATGHGREVAETATGHGRAMAETATGHGYVGEDNYAYDVNNNPDIAMVIDPTSGAPTNMV